MTPAIPFPATSALARLGLVLAWLGGGAGLLVLLALAYLLKRRLGLDLVPGIDMLPDERIEAAIHAAAGLVGLAAR